MGAPASTRRRRRRPLGWAAEGVALCATVALLARAWHPIRAAYYGITTPAATTLRDFGRSDVLRDGAVEWYWAPVDSEVRWTPARDRDASLAGAPFPVFRPPLRRATVRLRAPSCATAIVQIKLRDAAGRAFRFVVRPVERGGACEDDEVFASEAEPATLSCFTLQSRPAAPLALARPPGPPPAPALWSTDRYDPVLAALDPLQASRAEGPSTDFRLAHYAIYSRPMGRAIISKVTESSQSLLLTSSEMLRGSIGQDVWLDAFAASPDFPYYVVLRSPLAYHDVTERTVMHLKGFVVDERYGQYGSAVLSSGPGRFEFSLEAFDPVSIQQLRALVTAPLTGGGSPALGEAASPLGRLYYNAPAPRASPGAADLPRFLTPFERALYEHLWNAGSRVVLLLPHDLSTWVWRELAGSVATHVLVAFNMPLAYGDLTAERLREIDAILRAGHPTRVVRYVGVEDPASGAWMPVHMRAFLFDGERCILSESSFSPLGTRYSDDSFLWAAPPLCRRLRSHVRDFFGLPADRSVPAELTAPTSLSFARAAGTETERPHREYYDVPDVQRAPVLLTSDELENEVAPFLD